MLNGSYETFNILVSSKNTSEVPFTDTDKLNQYVGEDISNTYPQKYGM